MVVSASEWEDSGLSSYSSASSSSPPPCWGGSTASRLARHRQPCQSHRRNNPKRYTPWLAPGLPQPAPHPRHPPLPRPRRHRGHRRHPRLRPRRLGLRVGTATERLMGACLFRQSRCDPDKECNNNAELPKFPLFTEYLLINGNKRLHFQSFIQQWINSSYIPKYWVEWNPHLFVTKAKEWELQRCFRWTNRATALLPFRTRCVHCRPSVVSTDGRLKASGTWGSHQHDLIYGDVSHRTAAVASKERTHSRKSPPPGYCRVAATGRRRSFSFIRVETQLPKRTGNTFTAVQKHTCVC